jgi:ABC-type uncharacterized transport system permease subunit
VTGSQASIRFAPWINRGLAIVGHPIALSIVISLAIGALITAASGSSPITAFEAIASNALSSSGVRNTLARMVPIAGMAFVFAIPFRSGVVNLGGEGQMVFGGLAAAGVAIYAPGPSWFVISFAMLVGMAAGAAWAAIPALGQSHLLLPILITSLLLNYVARSITGYIVRFHLLDPTATSTATVAIPLDRRLPLIPLVGGITVSLVFLLVLAWIVRIHNRRTVRGYEALMTGLNPAFARYGGVGVDRQRTTLMLAAGAIAGAVGAHLIIGQIFIFVDGDHRWPQALRDVLNSLKVLNPGGTIVMHDCKAPVKKHATSKHTTGLWNGTVWRAFSMLRITRPDLEMWTVDQDHGVGIVRRGTQEPYVMHNVMELTHDYYRHYMKAILNLVEFEEFFEKTVPAWKVTDV